MNKLFLLLFFEGIERTTLGVIEKGPVEVDYWMVLFVSKEIGI